LTKLLLTCGHCDDDVAVGLDNAVLRLDADPPPSAELFFSCPTCGHSGTEELAGDLLRLVLVLLGTPLTPSTHSTATSPNSRSGRASTPIDPMES
jgi:hypothetical protein